MKAETKIIIGIFCFVLLLGIAGIFVKDPKGKSIVMSPFSTDFNVLSMFSNRSKLKKPTYTVYGYLPYWTIDLAEKTLRYDKITDIAYFGLNINADGTFRKKTNEGDADPGYNQWQNNDKLDKIISDSKKSGVRVALTIISHNDEISDKFLNCRACWKTLEATIGEELASKKLTDVNLNFEYVEYTSFETAQKYTEFTKELATFLHTRDKNSKLVVATFADSAIKPRVTSDIEGLGENSDGIFIMAYDFHQSQSDNAGPVSPIGGIDVYGSYDINTMLGDYISKVPTNKLILGVPYYGYNWVVEKAEPNAIRIEGNDNIGFSESQLYAKIMDTIEKQNPEVKWDELSQEPYFTYIDKETGSIREVYFENEQSLKVKYEMVKNKKLQGVGIWALGYDDDRPELWELLGRDLVK